VGAKDETDFAADKLELALGWACGSTTISGSDALRRGLSVGDRDKKRAGSEPDVAVHFSFGQAF